MVNNFGENEKVCDILERDGAINIREIYLSGKRNLEEFGAFDNQYMNNALGSESKLQNIMSQKRQSEIGKIYGGKEHAENVTMVNSADDIDERDEGEYYSGSDSDSDEENKPTFGDQRKSLERSLREDSHIDHSRIVDPSIAAGN